MMVIHKIFKVILLRKETALMLIIRYSRKRWYMMIINKQLKDISLRKETTFFFYNETQQGRAHGDNRYVVSIKEEAFLLIMKHSNKHFRLLEQQCKAR